jgi:Integrase core domain
MLTRGGDPLPVRPLHPARHSAHIRSDNGPEFVAAKAVQEWIAFAAGKTAYIERGSPWENSYIESFNARLRDELLDGEIFYSFRRPESSSRVGGASTTRSGRTPHLDTSHQHRRCWCPPSPRGQLRYAKRLRRPRWRNGQP